MEIVSDLHLHSKYSRAVSKEMTLPVMARYAVQKGLNLLTASDWTHPLWFKEITNILEEKQSGIYGLKIGTEQEKQVRFLLSTEIASIFSFGGRVRRIHNLVFAPHFETAEKISKELLKRGCNLHSDGRPIIGLSSHDLLELILTVDENAFLIPCHVWTPHFGLYGSASGFDSIGESFTDLSEFIYGIETGLSSDPEMNWQMEELKNRSILSFSDAHSPAKMGREATVFTHVNKNINEFDYSFHDIKSAIKRENETLKIGYTLEFYPEEGKYHFSGHRNCNVVLTPKETKEQGVICTVCNRKLTEGVFVRVEQLADRTQTNSVNKKQNDYGLLWYTDLSHNHPPYVKLVPLLEIVAESMNATVASQKVKNMFDTLCKDIGPELYILLKAPIEKIESVGGSRLAEGVLKVRNGNIAIHPGYDGVYGVVKIWEEESKKETVVPQLTLEL